MRRGASCCCWAIKASLCWIIRAKKSSGSLLLSGRWLLADPTETAFVGQDQLQPEVSRSFHYQTSCKRHWGMNSDFRLLLYRGVFHLKLQLSGSNPGQSASMGAAWTKCEYMWMLHLQGVCGRDGRILHLWSQYSDVTFYYLDDRGN